MPYRPTVKVKTVLREQRGQRLGTLPQPPRLVPEGSLVPSATPPLHLLQVALERRGRGGVAAEVADALPAAQAIAELVDPAATALLARHKALPAQFRKRSRPKPEIDKPARRWRPRVFLERGVHRVISRVRLHTRRNQLATD